MVTRLLESIIPTIMCLTLLWVGMYMIYAVIRKKPLADPNRSDIFIASLPFWPKDLHEVLLVIIGAGWSLGSLVGLYGLAHYILE